MRPPKPSTTTKLYPVVQLSEAELKYYPWLQYRHTERQWTLYELDDFIAPHNISDKELAFYVALDRSLKIPIHHSLIQKLHRKHRLANSENVIDDSESFKEAFRLGDGKGFLTRDKLYSLYYEWSELPMSREKFSSIFNRKHYAIPKESAMINAFIVSRRNKQSEERLRAIRKREELAEIMYGREEKAVKKALWNFW